VSIIDQQRPAISDETGWRAWLEVEIGNRHGTSVVTRSRQSGPLTFQRPFYPEPNLCHLYLLHPPGGLVGGDRLRLEVTMAASAQMVVTTPGATKFYRSNSRVASQNQTLAIAEDASLEWLPQENIFFPDAEAATTTDVLLQPGSRFIGWDINCMGLPATQAGFGQGTAHLTWRVYREKKPILLESVKISSDKQPFGSAALRGLPVFGSLLATQADIDCLEAVRRQVKKAAQGNWAATLVEDLLIVRYLGPSVVEAKEVFIEVWKTLRPLVIGRPAILPRIWST